MTSATSGLRPSTSITSTTTITERMSEAISLISTERSNIDRRNTILNEAELTQAATSQTLKRIGAIATGMALGGGTGALVGWVAGPPGSLTGIIVGVVIGGIAGAAGGEMVFRSCCRYESYQGWENRINREYGEGDVNDARPSAQSLKEQLMSVFEEDEILSKYIDPISFALVQYPFVHPVSKQICDLNTYRMAIAAESCRRNPASHPTHPLALLCPITQTLLSDVKPESLEENVFVQAVICNRLVQLTEAANQPNLHEEVVRGLSEIKADFDRIRNASYEKCMKDLMQQKAEGKISVSVFQQSMIQLSQRFFGNVNFEDVRK